MTAAIELHGLRKVFRRGREEVVAVDGLDLSVASGEVFGLLGPNGAGKTTTVEICEGLQKPTAGDVVILGERWGARDDVALRERIGVTLQETRFFEKQTVAELIRVFASFHRSARPVDEIVELLSLTEKRDTRSHQLSGGQRQRLAVACALVAKPELLFLDEPTTGLDPQSRRSLWDVVSRFRADGGTVLLTTHYMDEAEQLCDRIAIVDHGRVVALGTPQELKERVGGHHVVEVGLDGDDARVAAFDWSALPGVHAHHHQPGRLRLTVDAPHATIPAVLAAIQREGLTLVGLATRQLSLEDVFVHLTGHRLREDA
jgi:ABC-2 type transport system ATP-binding protein